MSLEANIRRLNGITIFDLKGRMAAGAEGDRLREMLFRAFEGGDRWMLVNCAGLEHIDSSGVGDMLAAYASVVSRGGVVRLLNPTKRLSDILKLTRLDSLLDVERDESTALEGFNALRNARTQQKLAAYLK